MKSVEVLFRPFESEKLNLKNRLVMAPMTRSFSPGHIANEQVAGYYRRRAEGGVGLIITEGTIVNHKGANGYPNVPAIYGEKALAGWQQVVEQVHQAGAKIIPQLWHVGSVRRQGIGPDKQAPAYSPSGLYKPGKENGVAMTQQDINDVIAAFTQAAVDAQRIGFDGIEIHGAHGYLIDQFLWEGTNQRTDKYGGSLVKRAQFAIELVQSVRKAVGDAFPIIFRFSQWKSQDYGAKLAKTPEELSTLVNLLADAGVDIFHASTRRFWEPEFAGSDLNLAGWTQKLSGKPTITVGSVGLDDDFLEDKGLAMSEQANISGIDNLIERMQNHEFELAAVGRAILVDAQWPNKVKNGELDSLKPYTKEALMSLS